MIGHVTDPSVSHGLNRRELPEPSPGSHDAVLSDRADSAEAQRTKLDPPNLARQHPASHQRGALRTGQAPSRQQHDRLAAQPTVRELQKRSLRRIQPLEVIDRHQHRLLGREHAQHPEERDAQHPRIKLRGPWVIAQQRHVRAETSLQDSETTQTRSTRAARKPYRYTRPHRSLEPSMGWSAERCQSMGVTIP